MRRAVISGYSKKALRARQTSPASVRRERIKRQSDALQWKRRKNFKIRIIPADGASPALIRSASRARGHGNYPLCPLNASIHRLTMHHDNTCNV